MQLIINGETVDFEAPKTLLEIMKSLQLDGKVMAAAVNMNIVKEHDWATFVPNDGDKLEMLDFVGGG